MSIKILGGHAKGFSVKVPKNHSFRPTLSTLKRKVFDRYQNLSGYHFFDCFAGSGAIGLEALSRGAESGIFFEKSSKHFQLLKENTDLFNEKFKVQLDYRMKINNEDFIKSDFPMFEENAIYFIDPPYAMEDLYFKSFKKLGDKPDLYWIEGDRSKGPEANDILEKLNLKKGETYKIYEQGTHYILCVEKL